MLSPADAARLILEQVRPLSPVRRPLRDALDLVLAEDVTSPIDLPAWDNSAMDGYALRSSDLLGKGPIQLRVVETVPAGLFPSKAIAPGEATRIFTGAPLPQGADTVVRQEDTEPLPGERVEITVPPEAGRNIRRRGEDIRRGETVLTAGTPLGPAQLGVLASIACAEPLVHPAPHVAFLGSGDEIVDLDRRDEILAGRKVATSNSYTLHANIRRAGGVPLELGVAADSRASLRALFERIRHSDARLVVSTAGVSVGEHDLVREVLTALGGELKAWRIRMRPGAPVGIGTLFGRPWIGLPGNPVSTMVTFELFVRPAIRRLLGHRLPFRRTVPVVVEEPITLGPKLRHFLRALARPGTGNEARFVVRLTGPQGSGILTSMARANALLIVPEDRQAVSAGEVLSAILLDDPEHVAEPPF